MIAVWIILAYVVSGLLLARRLYRSLRPLTVPMTCISPGNKYHEHYGGCYRQPGVGATMMVDSTGEAVTFAVMAGMLWPVLCLGMAVRFVVTAGNGRQRPDEMEARIHELESQLGIRGE